MQKLFSIWIQNFQLKIAKCSKHFMKFDTQRPGFYLIGFVIGSTPQILLTVCKLCLTQNLSIIEKTDMYLCVWYYKRLTPVKLAAKWKVQKSTQTLKHHNNPIVNSFGWALTIEVIVVINLERLKGHLCCWDMCKCDFARLESREWRASGDHRPH